MGKIIMKVCIKCGEEKILEQFAISKQRKSGYTGSCKKCDTARRRKRYYENKESEDKAKKIYRENNRERFCKIKKRNRDKMRNLVIEAYGAKCKCCGLDDRHFLQIDHVHNNGNVERKIFDWYAMLSNIIKNNFPDSYQLLCANCNYSKKLNGGKCIHQTRKENIECQELTHKQSYWESLKDLEKNLEMLPVT